MLFREGIREQYKNYCPYSVKQQTIDDLSPSCSFTFFGLWNVEEKLFMLGIFFLNLAGLTI